MPLPTAAELTDPNAKNSDMKLNLVQIVETLNDHESKAKFSVANAFQSKRMAITGDFMDLGVVDPDALVTNLTDSVLINKSISYGENGTNINQLTQNKSCLYPTGLKVDSAIAKISLEINVNSLQPNADSYIGGIGIGFGQTAFYWHAQDSFSRIAKKVGTGVAATKVSAAPFTTGNLKIEAIAKSDRSIEIKFTQGVNSYSITDTVDGFDLSLFVYAGINIDVKARYESISNITNETLKELDILQPNPPIASQKLLGVYIDSSTWEVTTNASSSAYATFKVLLEPNQKLKIQTTNGNRLRAGVSNSLHSSYDSAFALDRVIFNDDTKSSFEFENDANGKELYVYAAITNITAVTMVAESAVYRTKKPILAEGLAKPIGTKEISDYSVTAEKTDFLEVDTSILDTIQRSDITILHYEEPSLKTVVGRSNGASTTFVAEILPYQRVKVKFKSGVSPIRFRIVVMDDEVPFSVDEMPVYKVINLDNTLRDVEFINDGKGKYIVVTLHPSQLTNSTVEITGVLTSLKGIALPQQNEVEQSFALSIGAILDNSASSLGGKATYASLAHVKYDYRSDAFPNPVGWLYLSTKAPYRFKYSNGRPDNILDLCAWNSAITWNGSKNPFQYTHGITNDGDIISVARGDLLGNGEITPDARQNPIIYPAGDYANPIIIEFGERIKPTAWLGSYGFCPVPGQDFFLMSEYTRTVHEKMYIWKVSKPYSNPENWRRVVEFTVDRGPNNEDVGQKHIHNVQYDPWSGQLVASTGDYGIGPRILVSSDLGETWTVQAEGSEKHCRLLQLSFAPEGVYWATDSGAINTHSLFFIPRNIDKKINYAIPNHQELYAFPRHPGAQATYTTVRLHEPNGLLFLDRQDTIVADTTMKVYFWSFETNSMHIIGEIKELQDGQQGVGFRCDGMTAYQSSLDPRIVVGYNTVRYQNSINAIGNKADDRICNLTLVVNKIIRKTF